MTRVDVTTPDDAAQEDTAPEHDPTPPDLAGDDDGAVAAIGGRRPALTTDRLEAGVGGTVADQLRARYRRSRLGRREFPLPGWEGGLVLVGRPFTDVAAFSTGVTHETFIVESTAALILVDDDGERHPLPGWGDELAALMGLTARSATELVRLVLETAPRVDALATALLLWQEGVLERTRDELGE